MTDFHHVKHIVMYSGGVCSWAAAKRVVERHGADATILLFADTMMEDEDLYTFLDASAANVGAELVRIADGRNPWELMAENKCIANTGKDFCSRILKRELLDKWLLERFNPHEITVHFGLDWTEEHRLDRLRKTKPYQCSAPMTEDPRLTKERMLAWLKSEGLKVPRLYSMGFPHNNCGGFCVKAGQAHFAHLLKMMPERYAWHEQWEEKLRGIVGDYSILRDRIGGTTKPLTLKKLREQIQNQMTFDIHDWGGCGCAVE